VKFVENFAKNVKIVGIDQTFNRDALVQGSVRRVRRAARAANYRNMQKRLKQIGGSGPLQRKEENSDSPNWRAKVSDDQTRVTAQRNRAIIRKNKTLCAAEVKAFAFESVCLTQKQRIDDLEFELDLHKQELAALHEQIKHSREVVDELGCQLSESDQRFARASDALCERNTNYSKRIEAMTKSYNEKLATATAQSNQHYEWYVGEFNKNVNRKGKSLKTMVKKAITRGDTQHQYPRMPCKPSDSQIEKQIRMAAIREEYPPSDEE